MKTETLLPHVHALSQYLEGNVTHWLSFGSLLGSVREGNIIEGDWDVDMDYMDNGAHAHAWLVGHAEEIRKETGFILKDYGSYVLRLFWNEGVDLASERSAMTDSQEKGILCIDLFSCTTAGRRVCHGIPYHDYRTFFVDGLSVGKLGNYAFPIPRHAATLLEHRYGKDWKTPRNRKEFYATEAIERIPFKDSYTAVVPGVFDLFHVGHSRLLARAQSLFEKVWALVEPDQLTESYKRKPVINQAERFEIVWGSRYVDHAHIGGPITLQMCQDLGIDYAVCGDDPEEHLRQFYGELMDVDRLHVVPRTEGISTTQLLERLCHDASLAQVAG